MLPPFINRVVEHFEPLKALFTCTLYLIIKIHLYSVLDDELSLSKQYRNEERKTVPYRSMIQWIPNITGSWFGIFPFILYNVFGVISGRPVHILGVKCVFFFCLWLSYSVRFNGFNAKPLNSWVVCFSLFTQETVL